MKLWHDDIRPAPEGWVWARTNEAAKLYLQTGEVVEISMDHDMGLDGFSEEEIDANPELLFGMGQSPHTGLDLVHWMVDREIVPAKITIHSWNPEGARAMAARFNYFGYDVVVSPYKVRR
jgi:hypothetical protein